ncbi:MAG TPA: hypothetical protein VF695_08615 [Sphingomonas sp.]|jgi:hypothetical protein
MPLVVGDAVALFRARRDVLLRVAAPFLFLPVFALALLVPPAPALTRGTDDDGRQVWAESVLAWAQAHGGWYLLAYAIAAWGAAFLYAVHLDCGAATVGAALARGTRALPRYLLAMVLVSIPVGAGLLLWIIPGIYAMGRLMLVGPALAADRRLGVRGAITRSLAMTHGHGLTTTALAALPLAGDWLLGQPFLMIAAWMRGQGLENPVALAVVHTVAAVIAMAATLAQCLLAVALYRRLASNGT